VERMSTLDACFSFFLVIFVDTTTFVPMHIGSVAVFREGPARSYRTSPPFLFFFFLQLVRGETPAAVVAPRSPAGRVRAEGRWPLNPP